MDELYIVFEGEIDLESTKKLYNALTSADPHKYKFINLIFSSTGGSTYFGFFLANTIQNSQIPVRIHANNHIDSIANIIYLSTKERTAEVFARFYIHGALAKVIGYKKDLEEEVNSLKIENERIVQYIADNTDLSFEDIEKMMEERESISAPEALECGIVKSIEHIEIPPAGVDRIEIPYIIEKKRND